MKMNIPPDMDDDEIRQSIAKITADNPKLTKDFHALVALLQIRRKQDYPVEQIWEISQQLFHIICTTKQPEVVTDLDIDVPRVQAHIQDQLLELFNLQ